MAMVVGLSAHGIFGLKYVPPHNLAVMTVVETTMAALAPLRFPPPTIQLEQLSRPLLLHLARHSNVMYVQRCNKTQLAQIVFDEWDTITEGLAPDVNGRKMQTVHEFFRLNPQALAPPVLPALPRVNPYDDSDDGSSSAADSILQQIPDPHAYNGQPHRQPNLPSGWATPRSAGTTEILDTKTESEFVPDTESENGGDFVNDNVMDNKKIQDKLKEYATMTRSCSHDEVKVDVKVGETTFPFFYKKDTSGHDLADFLDFRTDGKLNHGNVLLSLNGSFPPLYENLMSYLNPDDVLVVQPRVRGGGVRKHITKENAMKELKAKSLKSIPEHTPVAEDVVYDEDFKRHLDKCREKMDELKMLFAQNVPVLRLAVRNASNENLGILKNIMEKKVRGGRGDTTEVKFLQSLEYLFPLLSKIENGSKELMNLHREITAFLLEKFVELHGEYENGAMKLDVSPFLMEINTEMRTRDVSANAAVQNAQSNCVIN